MAQDFNLLSKLEANYTTSWPLRRNKDVKAMLGLYARRETAVIDERSSHGNSGRDIEPPDLLRNLIHDFRSNSCRNMGY